MGVGFLLRVQPFELRGLYGVEPFGPPPPPDEHGMCMSFAMCVCVRAHVSACLFVCLPACLSVFLFVLPCIRVYLPACLPIYRHTYRHVHNYACTRTFVHGYGAVVTRMTVMMTTLAIELAHVTAILQQVEEVVTCAADVNTCSRRVRHTQ